MAIEELIWSCLNEDVALATVRCVGCTFFAAIEDAARDNGMTPGAFVVHLVQRFARRGNEAEARAVRAAMIGSQQPLLAGLHRLLCITLMDARRPPRRSEDVSIVGEWSVVDYNAITAGFGCQSA